MSKYNRNAFVKLDLKDLIAVNEPVLKIVTPMENVYLVFVYVKKDIMVYIIIR
jgi:hypothetical protein